MAADKSAMAQVRLHWPEPGSPEEALSRFLADVGIEIQEYKYELDKRTARSLSFKRRYLSTMGKLIGLLIFPIGILVWLFYRQDETFSFLATENEEEGGTTASVRGSVHSKLQSSFAELAEMRKIDAELKHVIGAASENGNGSQAAVVDGNGSEPQAVDGNGSDPESQAVNGNGSRSHECAEMDDELQRIYALVGKPHAFKEAKGKVEELADKLTVEGVDRDEALRRAYTRSLTEHREYLAAKGISE
jgi:hypothetical protein